MVALGGVVLAVIVLSSRPAAEEPDTPPSSTSSTTVNAPAVEVPPSLPPGELVEQTLQWTQVSGLEDATRIGGLVEFDDAYWIVGRSEGSLTAWRSEAPTSDPWTAVSVIDEDAAGWRVEDVERVKERLIVAASDWRSGFQTGAMYESDDGFRWRRHSLDTGRSDLPTGVAQDIIPVEKGVVLTGQGHSLQEPPEIDLEALSPEVRELIRTGQATVRRAAGEIRLVVPPGISVARLPLDESPEPENTTAPVASEPLVWWGENLTNLNVDSSAHQPLAQTARLLEDGRYVGQTGIRLAFSEDGRTWEPTGPFFGSVIAFAPWNDGFAVQAGGSGEEPVYWTEGSKDTVALLPDQLRRRPPVLFTGPTAGNWGLALTQQEHNPVLAIEPVEVAETEAGALYLTSPLTLLLVRDGETVWEENTEQIETDLDEAGNLRFSSGPDSVTVGVDEWLEAVLVASGGIQPGESTEVIHTVDGEEWSSTTWKEMSGSEYVSQLTLLGTDRFLLVADQSDQPVPRLGGVVVGTLPH